MKIFVSVILQATLSYRKWLSVCALYYEYYVASRI